MLIRILPDLVKKINLPPAQVTAAAYREFLSRIDASSLSADAIRAAQGSAGMKEIYQQIKQQLRI
jgi:hypothetical protein